VSNIFLGQGPWTAWQMVGWGGVGVAGAGLAKAYGDREIGRVPLAIACGVAGLAFGALLDVYQTTLAARQDLATYLAVSGTSLPYNLAHAIGNVGFCLLIGPAFIRALRRYRRRFEVRWRSAAVVAGVMLLGFAATASASPASKAARYLERVQNRDGGFGGAKGQRSSGLFTGWSALGLASARRNPRDVARKGGKSITRYMRGTRAISDLGELQRTILVLKTAGISPRRYRGRNLVADLLRRQSGDGSWRSNVALTTFGVLALRGGGEAQTAGSVQRGAAYVERSQNPDGGFGFVARAESDVDVTGAALQTLAAAGRGGGTAARKGISWLRSTRNADGGFGQSEGKPSNSQSTSWAVQGLVAVRATVGPLPVRYLAGLQRRDGHIRYSATSDQTPVWVTAQALDALQQKAFPLAPAPRRAKAQRRAPSGPPARKAHRKRAGGATKPAAPRSKPKRSAPPAESPAPAPAPAPAVEPAAPAAPSAASPTPPAATKEDPTAAFAMKRFGRGDGSGPWVAGVLVAGVAGLAVWRLARRRRT
jgi:energy-coupling factor transport system substrate-specific component